MAKKIRCMWFNDEGHPRYYPSRVDNYRIVHLGCPKPAGLCRFVHPEDEDWKTAAPSRRPNEKYYGGEVPRTPPPQQQHPLPLKDRLSTDPRAKNEPFPPPMAHPMYLNSPVYSPFEGGFPDLSREHRNHKNEGMNREQLDRERDRDREREHGKERREWNREKDRDAIYNSDAGYDWAKDARGEYERILKSAAVNYSSSSRAESSAQRQRVQPHVSPNKPPPDDPMIIDRPSSTPPIALRALLGLTEQKKSKDRSMQPPPPSEPLVQPPPLPPQPSLFAASSSEVPWGGASTSANPAAPQQMYNSMPPPSFPSSLSKLEPDSPKLTLEERRQFWDDRITLIAECVRAREEHERCEANFKTLRRMAENPRHLSAPQFVRDKLQSSIETAERRVNESMASMEELLAKLAGTDFWPTKDIAQVELDTLKMEADSEKVSELANLVDMLKHELKSMNENVQRIDSRCKETSRFVRASVASKSGETSSSLKRSSSPVELRVPKKRKVDEDVTLASGSVAVPLPSISTTEAYAASAVEQASPGGTPVLAGPDVRRWEKRMSKLEHLTADLENAYNLVNDDRRGEMTAIVDSYIDDLRRAVKRGDRAHQTERIDALENEILYTGKDVTELSNILADLYTQTEERKAREAAQMEEFESIKKEREDVRKEIQACQAEISKLRDEVARQQDERQRLLGQLSQSGSPEIPSVDELYKVLSRQLIATVQEHGQHILNDTRREIALIIQESPAVQQLSQLQANLANILRLQANANVNGVMPGAENKGFMNGQPSS